MIEALNLKNVDKCTHLANLLWPHAAYEELYDGFVTMISSSNGNCFLCREERAVDGYCGFVQVSLRTDYVEGSNSSPVGYIEGIYITEAYRKQGIAKRLIQAAESWAKEKGCKELASDCELENQLSIDFHNKIGFEEANRIVCFIKPIE